MGEELIPGRSVKWVDGFPYPVYEQPYNKQTYAALFPAALSARYEMRRLRDKDYDAVCGNNKCVACPYEIGDYAPGEEQHRDKTFGEVAAWRLAEAAANGDLESFREVSDRTIGKPKQLTESITATVSLDQILQDLVSDAMPKVEAQSEMPGVVDAIVEESDWLEGI